MINLALKDTRQIQSFDILRSSWFSNKMNVWGGRHVKSYRPPGCYVKKKKKKLTLLLPITKYSHMWQLNWSLKVNQGWHYPNFILEEINARQAWTCVAGKLPMLSSVFITSDFCKNWSEESMVCLCLHHWGTEQTASSVMYAWKMNDGWHGAVPKLSLCCVANGWRGYSLTGNGCFQLTAVALKLLSSDKL